jgi:2-haloacid dehalogenase
MAIDPDPLSRVHTLTFDIFGTVLDLVGSIRPTLDQFLADHNASVDGATFWPDWRLRQRIEQHQDTILMLGHPGYLDSARRAFVYSLRKHNIEFQQAEVERFMRVFEELQPYPDAVEGLNRLGEYYRLVALSNGNTWLIEHLVENNINAEFDSAISVDRVGCFKPHPSVYRHAAQHLAAEPGEIMMVAAHSFDILGARACGYRGAYVNRYGLPYESSPLQPDLVTTDFLELADRLANIRK